MLLDYHLTAVSKVRRRFRFQSEKLNRSENFVSLGREKNVYVHLFHIEAKQRKQTGKKRNEAKRTRTEKLLNVSFLPLQKPVS